MIQLARAVIAAADKRQYLSGVRVEGDEGYLRIGDRCCIPCLSSTRMELLHLLIHHFHVFVDGFGGNPL